MNKATLYDKAKNGKIKVWMISVDKNTIITHHGYIDGKLTEKRKTIHKGKNIGKKNETTPEQQALFEMQSKVKLQQRKGYSFNLQEVRSGKQAPTYLPMLAKTYNGTLPDSCYAQPKLNGIRCVAVKQDYCVTLWSRTGKDLTGPLWDLARILNRTMTGDTIWDGELYVHGWDFSRITRAVKKESPDSYRIEFHVYDIPLCNTVRGDETKFALRNVWLSFGKKYIHEPRVKFIPAISISSEVEMKARHDLYVQDGYEGIILRDGDANYLWKHRGKELIKYKEFIDEEFPIIGYRAGTGVDEGTIIFKCHIGGRRNKCLPYNDPRSGYFDVRPRGTVSERRAMYSHGWRYVGEMLTVRYQERSIYDMPVFPVGISVRDYE